VDEQQTTEAQTTTEEPEVKKGPRPPPRDLGLWDYFTHHDIGGRAQNYDVRGSSTIDPDKGLVHSGAVGFRQRSEAELEDRALAAMVRRDALYTECDTVRQGVERTSRAQKNRGYGVLIAQLSPLERECLRRVYGPQDREPYLRELSEGEVPKGEVAALREWNKRRARLGPLRMLLPLTGAVEHGHMAWLAAEEERAFERRMVKPARPPRAYLGMEIDIDVEKPPATPRVVWVADVLTTDALARTLARAKCEASDWLDEVWGRWAGIRGPLRIHGERLQEPEDLR
jgi:hypothetical protein